MTRDQLPAIVQQGALTTPTDPHMVPALIADAGEQAAWRFIEFFGVNIANDHTRRAYARACGRFFAWCERRGLTLAAIRPFDVATSVKELQEAHAAPSVKQQLAAVRMLFDWLVTGQVVPMNPAAAVRGPKHVVKTGKTPVLDGAEWRRLIDSISTETVRDLRDRALIATLSYSFARIGTALKMRVKDLRPKGAGWQVQLHEKGGKQHAMPCHHALAEALRAYIDAAGIAEDHKAATAPLTRRQGPCRNLASDSTVTTMSAIVLPDPDAASEGLLTFRLDNKSPVALDDLTTSLNALGQAYGDYLAATGEASPRAGVKLYIHDLRTGSIIAVLRAIAEQGHFLFGEHGLVPTLQSAFDHADTLAGFLASINDIVQFFLGNPEAKTTPTRKQAEQIVQVMEPVAKDAGAQLNIQCNGPTEIHVHYNSQVANAVQNSARRYLGPTLPSNQILRDEILTLYQVRGDPKAQAGDRGRIDSISQSPVKLRFTSEAVKKAIVDTQYPFQQAFLVDVEVKTAGGKPALYTVLELKESFPLSPEEPAA